MICYLDMDGVIVDFVGAAIRTHNYSLLPKEITWSFPIQIGFDSIDDQRFWKPLGFDFWAGLGWTKEGYGVLDCVEKLFGKENIVLVTAPCPTPGCIEGKLEWVRRHIPQYTKSVFLGQDKHKLAGRNKLLVDDRDENIKKFSEAGGFTLKVPRPWNTRRNQVNDQGEFDLDYFKIELESTLELMRL